MKEQSKSPNVNIFKTQSGRIARTVSGWKKLPQDQTLVEGLSVTVPNMAYEIKDLLTNYSKGIDLIGSQLEGIYDDSPDHDQDDVSAFNRLDIAEQAETLGNLIQRSKDIQTKIKEHQEKIRSDFPHQSPPPQATQSTPPIS